MNSVSDIRYAVLQPLSGGMYLAAENAIGHPAEFIISYPGFDTPKYDKDGRLVDAGNEYNLIKYLGLSTDNTFEEIKNANELKLSSFNNYSLEQINAAINDINKNYATLTDSDKKIVEPQLQKTLSEFTATYNVIFLFIPATNIGANVNSVGINLYVEAIPNSVPLYKIFKFSYVNLLGTNT